MYSMISCFFFLFIRNGCFWVKRTVPLNGYIGMVETFSNYQKMLQNNPAEAERLSNDIRNK